MSNFEDYKSAKTLKLLSENPIDLTKKGVLSAKRVEKFKIENCGYKLLYSCERVDEKTVKTLMDLALEASCIKKIQKMQKGEIFNFIKNQDNENRKVMHTSLRDFFGDIYDKESSKVAFLEVEKLKEFVKDMEGKFTNIVQIGIGGSVLGVKTMASALLPYSKKNIKIHFISNIDPDEISILLDKIDLSKTLFICVSKSGSTLETLVNEEIIRKKLKSINIEPKDKIVSITTKNSFMDDDKKYLKVFYLWDYIGGRFSTTSMVGGVLISFFLGFDNYLEILKGANSMDRVSRSGIEKNLPLFSALLTIWNRNFLGYQTMGIISYSSLFFDLISQLQQCYMESNGKSIDKNGRFINFKTSPIVWGGVGTDSQHSFFQYLHQGKDISFLKFIGYSKPANKKDFLINNTYSQEKLLANMFAQAISLAIGKKDANSNKNFEGNRPTSILIGKEISPFSLGALISFFEHEATFQGFLWDINSFDQEGVQLGKKIAGDIISIFAKEHSSDLEEAFLKELFK